MLHAFIAKGDSRGGAGDVEDGNLLDDIQLLLDAGQAEGDLLGEGLAGADDELGEFLAGEARGLDANGIGPGVEIGKQKITLLAGAGFADLVGVGMGGADEGAGDGVGLRIEDAAGESAGAVGNLCE